VDAPALPALRALDTALRDEINPTRTDEIDCLPFHLNQVQLRIFMALLLGAHVDAGQALAVFAGCANANLDHYTAAGRIADGLSMEAYDGYVGGLAQLRDQLRGNAWAFLASGSAHEFGDVTAEARDEAPARHSLAFALSR
jgi:hypothetical protein